MGKPLTAIDFSSLNKLVDEGGHQAMVFGWRNGERYACAHAPDSHASLQMESHTGLMSGSNH